MVVGFIVGNVSSFIDSLLKKSINNSHRSHVLIYSAILLLDASLLILLTGTLEGAPIPTESNGGPLSEEALAFAALIVTRRAKWTAQVVLGAKFIIMTLLPLLNRSLDRPGPLFVSNRHIRLLPRIIVAIVALCLPAESSMLPRRLVVIDVILLFAIVGWERETALEKGAKILEPKHSEEE
jgi:hypothetical protein